MPECAYHDSTDLRRRLAEALASGTYQQIPREQRLDCALRDEDGNHSITGVATAELTTAVWIKRRDQWATYPFDIFTQAYPKLSPVAHDYAAPDQDFLDQLERTGGPGDSRGCPEETACTLGLHEDKENSQHPELIWFKASLLTPEEKKLNSIPQDWYDHYLLDAIDFKHAAALLLQYPDLLVSHCSCEPEQSETD